VWVEEIDGLAPEESIPVVFNGDGTTTQGTIVASIMHLEGAEAVADYGGEDFYAGTPAVSANAYGDGRAYYVGTPLDERGMDMLIKSVIRHAGVESTETPDGVELCRRYGDDGRVFTFTINLTGAVRGDMQAYEVRVTSDSA
jgi:beta-galactosidase